MLLEWIPWSLVLITSSAGSRRWATSICLISLLKKDWSSSSLQKKIHLCGQLICGYIIVLIFSINIITYFYSIIFLYTRMYNNIFKKIFTQGLFFNILKFIHVHYNTPIQFWCLSNFLIYK